MNEKRFLGGTLMLFMFFKKKGMDVQYNPKPGRGAQLDKNHKHFFLVDDGSEV